MTEEKAKYAVSAIKDLVYDYNNMCGESETEMGDAALDELAAYKNLAEWVRKFKKMGYLVNDELFGALAELDKVTNR